MTGTQRGEISAWLVKPHWEQTLMKKCYWNSHDPRARLADDALQPLLGSNDPLKHMSFNRVLFASWHHVTEHWGKGYSQLRNSFLGIMKGVCVGSKTYINAPESYSLTVIPTNCSSSSGVDTWSRNEQKSVWKTWFFMVDKPSVWELHVWSWWLDFFLFISIFKNLALSSSILFMILGWNKERNTES